MDAIDIIRHEHSRIATVLRCFDRLAASMAEEEKVADLAAFEAILDYLQSFPERFHHPKEDEYLFAVMKVRRPELAPTIEHLTADHADGERRLTDLTRALEKLRSGEDAQGTEFRRRVADYVASERAHMKSEETEVFEHAREALSAEEMQALGEAFKGNADPLFGERQHKKYDALYAHLLDVIPAPDGFAEPWQQPAADEPDSAAIPVPPIRHVLGHI